jgi:hypothetical protein
VQSPDLQIATTHLKANHLTSILVWTNHIAPFFREYQNSNSCHPPSVLISFGKDTEGKLRVRGKQNVQRGDLLVFSTLMCSIGLLRGTGGGVPNANKRYYTFRNDSALFKNSKLQLLKTFQYV